jgi:outer membrane lipoprotein-sorting protein
MVILMKRPLSALYFLFMSLLVFCVSCSPRPARFSIEQGMLLSPEEQGSILSLFLTRDKELSSLRQLARVRFETSEGSQTGRQVLLFERPDRVRLETLPLNTNYSLSLLVALNGQATYVDFANKKAYQGNAERELFGRFLKVPASERVLLSVFSGRVPTELIQEGDVKVSRLADGTLQLNRGEGLFVWHLSGTDQKVFRFFATDTLKDKPLVDITYEWGTPVKGVELPKGMTMFFPTDGSRTFLEFTQQKVNEDIRDDLFEAVIPGDFDIQ